MKEIFIVTMWSSRKFGIPAVGFRMKVRHRLFHNVRHTDNVTIRRAGIDFLFQPLGETAYGWVLFQVFGSRFSVFGFWVIANLVDWDWEHNQGVGNFHFRILTREIIIL